MAIVGLVILGACLGLIAWGLFPGARGGVAASALVSIAGALIAGLSLQRSFGYNMTAFFGTFAWSYAGYGSILAVVVYRAVERRIPRRSAAGAREPETVSAR